MFDGLLKSKFYTKCKSDIKLTRSRIEVIQKKRNAMQKYLRNDVSDLLKNGLGMNAYNRVEGLLIEMNKSECYELINRCCELISNHLSSMNKQRDCPVECRESASSLMFAAARIADLPELRELRDVFAEKYGKSLDSFVNKEFVEKLKHGIPSREKKLQLLQEIAAEAGLLWNSKSLDVKLFEERANNKDLGKETNDGNFKAKNESLAPKDDVKSQNARVMKPIEHHDRSSSPAKKIRPDKEEERGEKHRGNNKYGLIAPPYSKSIAAEKTKIDDHTGEKEAKPAPKSVRRRHLKPIGEIYDEDKEKEANNNKAQAAQARKILKFLDKGNNDNLDEEERAMDRLLRHYSRKNGTIHSRVKSEVGLKLLHEKKEPCLKTGPKEEAKGKEFGPTRVLSLPGESMGPNENSKRHFRASSFQPEILGENNNHVHPKLPDCDDFEATLAELRRRK